MWHEYVNATSVDEVLDVLARRRERARIVAGATDLLIEFERGARPSVETLIDVTRIPGLDAIRLGDDGWIRLGPLVTHNDACASALIQAHALPLAQACWQVGAPQIRNRATLAGNLITASPAGDSLPALMALEAVVTLRSAARGERRVPLSEFFTGVRRTVLQPDEMLVEISFSALQQHERGTFVKLALRRAQAISVVSACAVVGFRPPRKLAHARIALGAVAPTVVRAAEAELFLVGKALDEATVASAALMAQAAARPIDDIRAPASYRRDMVAVLVSRALRAIAAGEERGALPEHPAALASPPQALTPAAMSDAIVTTINGRAHSLPNTHDKTLLRLLREDAGLIGTKEGCAEGECGACTVFLDGAAVMSCLVPAPRAHGAAITTIEGLAAEGGLHPLQQAFIDEAAVQCGYCTPGFLMAGAKLLDERPHPTRDEVEHALAGNLCRCTGYHRIFAAFDAVRERAHLNGQGS